MMMTVDQRIIGARPDVVWQLACAVEAWPRILPHYRWVTRTAGEPGSDGVVEMAAWRPFGPLRWPTWWRSKMQVDQRRQEIRYQHIAGITRGMDVLWTIHPTGEGESDVTITHRWGGPSWWLLRRPASEWIIGPVFVHGIASRTLAGIARAAEGT